MKEWEHLKDSFEVVDGRGKSIEFMPIFLEKAKNIPVGKGISVIQNFEPVPLYSQMKELGFDYTMDQISKEEYRVYFYRQHTDDQNPVTEDVMAKHVHVNPKRTEAILQIVLDYFQRGASVTELEERFKKELGTIKPVEFAYVEQKIKEHGVSDEDFEGNVEELIHIFKKSLDKSGAGDFPAGHPIHTFKLENRVLEKLLDEMKETVRKDSFDAIWWAEAYKKLWQLDKHYLRKEHQLFPQLEKKGFDKPSTVMWTLHDNVRKLIKDTRKLLEEGKYHEFLAAQENVYDAVKDMIFKEEKILFPTSLDMLTGEEWGEIRKGEEEIGYCLIDNPPMWTPKHEGHRDLTTETEETSEGTDHVKPIPFTAKAGKAPDVSVGAVKFDEGYLTLEQVNLMLKYLPLDISFVDEHDRVRFYSKGSERVFPRSPGDIGREVRYCHPPKSVPTVMKILDEFKAGNKDIADFWINYRGRFLYIRYFAVRDEEGNYKGVLEVMQDVTEIRQLEGERRLLDWD